MTKRIFAKLDPGFFENRKVIRAGRNGRDLYLFALCENADHGARGYISSADVEPWYVAHRLGISEAEARDGLDRAIEAGLLARDGDRLVIVGWDDDWSRLPKSDAQRAKEYRERTGRVTTRHEHDVTSHAESDASPIRGEERRGEQSARDAPDSLSSDSDSGIPRKTRKQTGAAQPLPSAWEPSVAAAAYAQSQGLDVAGEARRFRLNAAQRGHTFADADAAFELFMSRSFDKGRHKPPKAGATTTKPRAVRQTLEDGTVVIDHGNGELVPEVQQGSEPGRSQQGRISEHKKGNSDAKHRG